MPLRDDFSCSGGGWMDRWVRDNICLEFHTSTCHSISSISVTMVTLEETPGRPCETLWKRQRPLQTLWQRHIVIHSIITSSRIRTCQRQVSLKRKLQLLHCRGAYFTEVFSIARSFAIILLWNFLGRHPTSGADNSPPDTTGYGVPVLLECILLLLISQPVIWDHYLGNFFQDRYKGLFARNVSIVTHPYCLAWWRCK